MMLKILFALLLLLPSIAHADITTSLMSQWKFDEGSGTTATDSAGSNPGTINNATYTTGKIGPYALSFNGSTAWVNVGSFASIATSAKTFSLWVNPVTENNNDRLVSNSGGTAYSIRYNAGGVEVWDGNGWTNVVATSGGTLIWTHYIFVFDGAVHCTVYKNGVSEGQKTLTQEPSWANLGLGYILDGSFGNYYNGNMDEVRIYSRALTSGDAAELYAYTGAAITHTNTLQGTSTIQGASTIN